MRLYKYVAGARAALAIAGGSLKFTPVGELNDPMEVFPFFNEAEVSESLDRIRTHGCSEEQIAWLNCQQALLERLGMGPAAVPTDPETVNAIYRFAGYQHLPWLKAMLVQLIEIIRSRVGVLSLSERHDCVPMWAHYANQAKGFVVTLDDLDSHYPGDATGSLNAAKPVLYSDRFLGMTFEASTQERLFFAKLEDWRYEKEWRVVRALADCRFESGSALYRDTVPSTTVRAVICGWNVPEAEVQDLRRAVAEVNPAAVVLRATIGDGRISTDPPLPPG